MCGLSLDFSTDPSRALNRLRQSADTENVDSRVRLLKQMVSESLYAVDEAAVADAVLARARLRQTVAAPELRSERSERSGQSIRSFRRTRSARSFRLTSGEVGAAAHHR